MLRNSWIQDTIDTLAYRMMEKYNKERPIVFNTFQFYRVESPRNIRAAYHDATMNNYFLGAKLVRGAYMEKERDRAEELNYPSPIFPDKEDTDNAFNQALSFCLDHKQRIAVMCGSHNEYSNYYLTVLMEKHGMANKDERVWFSQLYGMSDNISFNLATARIQCCQICSLWSCTFCYALPFQKGRRKYFRCRSKQPGTDIDSKRN